MASSFPSARYLGIALAAMLIGSSVPDLAVAQTAKNVKCRGCVGARDLGKKSVKAKHLKDRAVRNKHIADEAITAEKIRDDEISGAKIQDNAISGAKLQSGAVTGDKIQNSAVTADHLAATAKPTGADSDEGNLQQDLTAIKSTVRSVTVTAPGPGLIVAVASGNLLAASLTNALCSITDTDSPDTAHLIQANGPNGITSNLIVPFGSTRIFEVSGGETTLNLVCQRTTGTDAKVIDPALSAFFVPNRY
jgi:hypothetical protein